MTQQDKDLLLRDLCARLPYGVIIQHPEMFRPSIFVNEKLEEYYKGHFGYDGDDVEFVKPYLRPMSSMTEEEILLLYKALNFYYLFYPYDVTDEWRNFKEAIKENKLFLPYPIWDDDLEKGLDYLNSIHADYRGLIEKGLAIEVTDENNPYK